MKVVVVLWSSLLLAGQQGVAALSVHRQEISSQLPPDRFRPSCPADLSMIQHFDPSLAEASGTDCVWVAIFRSSNNKPSVRDEFFTAMQWATDDNVDSGIERNYVMSNSDETPVAVARLTPSKVFDGCYVLDNMRCLLKKENTDFTCDGGSEHTEALCVAIDSLLIQYLKQNTQRFHTSIRTKSTLVSGALLEERGFIPVDGLHPDMATHVSSLDACMTRYATRAVSTTSTTATLTHGARERALQIISLLAKVDRHEDLTASNVQAQNNADDDYDPWAKMKSFF